MASLCRTDGCGEDRNLERHCGREIRELGLRMNQKSLDKEKVILTVKETSGRPELL